MRHYCTLFDINYLPNFLALYHSLSRQVKGIKIHAFCMDDKSFNYLKEYPDVLVGKIKCISKGELISEFPILSKIELERSIVEFYFTCSSFITNYVMEKELSANYVTYLDADLYFFDSPDKIFDEIGNSSIAIIPHNFFGVGKRYIKYGIYNVGWVTFKNDKQGRACLKSWKDNCEEWCFDYYDAQNKRFGDQKYLDNWKDNFKSVKVIEQKGANLAPWNVGQYNINLNKNGKLYVDNDPLIFYHFASFKKLKDNVYTTNCSLYLSRPNDILKSYIYKLYLDQIVNFISFINKDNVRIVVLEKNRADVNQTIKQKINKYFIFIIRWYYNDFIYI
ncbi:hypothetical protein V7S77_09970 [Aquirufa ecclesiirivi]